MKRLCFKVGWLFDKVVYYMTFALTVVICILLLAIMLLVTANVIMRSFFNAPIVGTMEITNMFVAVCGFCAMAMATYRGRNVSVDILSSKLSPRGSIILNSIASFLGVVVMAFVAYGAYVRLQRSISDNEITSILRLPMKYAFLLGWIGYVLTVCAQIIDFVRALQGKKMGKEAEHG